MKGTHLGLLLASLAVSAAVSGMTATAAAALSPSVATFPATSVGVSTATLNGTVNPNGAATKAYFEYGHTTSYGSKTAETSVGSGTSAQEINIPVSGLVSGAEYHYRIVASNSFGTSQGVDTSFATVLPPEVLSIGAEPDPSGESATLTALVFFNGESTSYQFEYGTASGSYTKTVPVPAEPVEEAWPESGAGIASYEVTGLAPGTTYFWRPVVSNVNGKGYGSEESFLSSQHPGVQIESATEVSSGGGTLNAEIETHETGTKYYFEYGTTTAYGSKTNTSELGGKGEKDPVSQRVGGLNWNTLYHYRLVAENSAGKTYSEDQTFTTLAAVALYVKGGGFVSSPLKLSSANFGFQASEVFCEETEFSGNVGTNPGAMHFAGSAKMQNSGGARCPYAPYTVKFSFPFKVGVPFEYGRSASGKIQTGKIRVVAGIYLGGSEQSKCEYDMTLSGTFATGVALETTLSGPAERVSGFLYCPPSQSVSGKFALTYSGTPVEAKPWP